ncbi:hypothetical protein LTR56_011462 [Elasticomyces elasticus]|nr:hypothetical protein LTR56_011462 [Elasticomyces elasticus]KAK3655944.1 hypothetical protein LTR22_009953 [Elasticomyces elasticus]KAK4921443.1 hypothetical protein LTR49_011097 [Elasticomyces elasticus]KAK5760085.1 hypothetical protein LTS12_009816 [Elasticomyces elasticus]
MAASSHSNAEVTGFFRLPPELRLAIYGLAITKADCMNIENSEAKINGSIILPVVMRVSKTMREDATDLCQKHLLEARSVLTGRDEYVQELLESEDRYWRRGSSWGELNASSRIRLGGRRQQRDGRHWMVRIDEVVTKLE